MSILRNLKVAKKLLLLIIPTILLTLFFLFQLSYQTHRISNQGKSIYNDTVYKNTALILNADRDIYQAAIAERTLVLSGNTLDSDAKDVLLKDYEENYNQVISRVDEAMQNLQKNPKLFLEFKEKEKQITLSELKDSFKTGFNNWLSVYNPATGQGDYNKKNEVFEDARDELNTMTELLDQYSVYITDRTQREVSTSINLQIVVIAVIALILSLITGYLISFLRMNIKQLTADMNALSKNDLSFTPHSTNSKDELGLLAHSISDMVHSLRNIIADLSRTSDRLTSSSKIMRLNSKEVTTSMNEIAKTAGEIAEGASNQAEDVQQLIEELGELGKAIDTTMQSADKLSTSSELIRNAIKEGVDSVNLLENITLKNQDAFQSIFTTIDTTSKNAGKIGEASTMIAGITNQTKLLALNASIEAARAGESGKGFAVVADEIRRLSEQSSNSTLLIDQMLGELMEDIHKASEQSKYVKEAVELQTKGVGDTKDKYTEIEKYMNDIGNEITSLDVASGSMEQSRAVVSDYASNVSAVSEESAASTQETSAATEQVLASMTTINQIVEDIDVMTTEIKTMIDKFKLA